MTPSETGRCPPQARVDQRIAEQLCPYICYVLDLWFERVAITIACEGRPTLSRRYIDDFVLCFQYREDALRLE